MIYELEHYTLADIHKLQRVALESENDKTTRVATALASILFAAAEMVGILVHPNITNDTFYKKCKGYKDGDYLLTNNRSNAAMFFQVMNDWGLEEISESDIEIMYELNRNGIIHSLFPKAGTGVAHNKEWQSIPKLFIEMNGSIHLNVAFLCVYVTRAVILVIRTYKDDNGFKAMVDHNFGIYTHKQNEDLATKQNILNLITANYPNFTF